MKKLTREYIESLVVSTKYFYTDKLTICIITPKNGFEILGKAGVIDPENFDKEIGEKIAYNNAIDQLWAHEGYLKTEKDLLGAQYHKDLQFFVKNNFNNE